MNGAYLAVLVFVLICLMAIDYRHKLVFFNDAKKAFKVTVSLLVLFLIWDILGVLFGVFYIGENHLLTGILIAPELPVEEVFFLSVLVYNPLIIYRFLEERN